MKPSTFAERFLYAMPGLPFSFVGREYFKPIYDSNSQIELFKTARQCAKSTFIANRIITRAVSIPGLQVLYEAPRKEQSSTFSYQKFGTILQYSPDLKPFLTTTKGGKIDGMAIQRYTCFKTGAFVKLSSTFNGADRDRGISINDLYIDETQDQHEKDVVILEEGLSASNIDPYEAFAGTPKSENNYIEKLWKKSKQIVWTVRCDACNTWQLPGEYDLEKTFAPTGLLCQKCERRINVQNGRWVARNPQAEFNGWHISQIMRLVKGMKGSLKWKDPFGRLGVYDKYKHYPPDKFHNEVLGFPYDKADRPLVSRDLKNIANENLPMQKEFSHRHFMYPIVMGIDWGLNNNSFTSVSISCFTGDKPILLYMRRFEGSESDASITAKIIATLCNRYKVSHVFCDNGFFWHYETEMKKILGNDYVDKNFNFIQYGGFRKELILKVVNNKDRKLLWQVSRNEIMNLFLQQIKQKKVGIFNYEEFTKNNFQDDYLSVSYEIRENKDRGEFLFFQTSGDVDAPTDCFHAHLYSWLGLQLVVPNKMKFFIEDDRKL